MAIKLQFRFATFPFYSRIVTTCVSTILQLFPSQIFVSHKTNILWDKTMAIKLKMVKRNKRNTRKRNNIMIRRLFGSRILITNNSSYADLELEVHGYYLKKRTGILPFFFGSPIEGTCGHYIVVSRHLFSREIRIFNDRIIDSTWSDAISKWATTDIHPFAVFIVMLLVLIVVLAFMMMIGILFWLFSR